MDKASGRDDARPVQRCPRATATGYHRSVSLLRRCLSALEVFGRVGIAVALYRATSAYVHNGPGDRNRVEFDSGIGDDCDYPDLAVAENSDIRHLEAAPRRLLQRSRLLRCGRDDDRILKLEVFQGFTTLLCEDETMASRD